MPKVAKATFETLSAKEMKMLEELMAKKKRIQKHDEEFFAEVDERKEEVIEHLGEPVSTEISESKYDESKIDEILKSYDCTFNEFCDYVLGEKQLEAYLEKDEEPVKEETSEEKNVETESSEKTNDDLFSTGSKRFWQ